MELVFDHFSDNLKEIADKQGELKIGRKVDFFLWMILLASVDENVSKIPTL